MGIENIPPPHLSADEHLLRLREEQLLHEGRQWLSRAAELYTHTSKIKIWVPVVGSMLMTGYYLYTIHARAAAQLHDATPEAVVETTATPTHPNTAPAAVAVADDAPTLTKPLTSTLPAGGAEDSDSDAELLRKAQEAHANHQPAQEAQFLQKVFDHSQTQQVCPAIGKAYEASGDLTAASRSLERCTSIAPQNVDTLLAFGHVLQEKADFKRAATLYRMSMQRDPRNLDAQTGFALMELKQNHLNEAGQTAQAVLRSSPDNTDALLVAGLVAWREAKLPDAEKIFSKGVGIDDHRADFHAFLGRVAEAKHQPQNALQEYERALALDPNDSDIVERRDRLKDVR